jgi:hypothetical protein
VAEVFKTHIEIKSTRANTTVSPLLPKFIGNKTFAKVNDSGMMQSPEVFLLECFKEIFFDSIDGDEGTDTPLVEAQKQYAEHASLAHFEAAIYALRGRRRTSGGRKGQSYYAPLYPVLANKPAGFRSHKGHAAKAFLFSGPLRQHYSGRGRIGGEFKTNADNASKQIVEALWGNDGDFLYKLVNKLGGTDFLSQIKDECGEQELDKEESALKIGRYVFSSTGPAEDIIRCSEKLDENGNVILDESGEKVFEEDELAKCIAEDFQRLCELEGDIPRQLWIDLLMTFLRNATPIWLLGQMQITTILYDWVIDALDNDNVPKDVEIKEKLFSRNRSLLKPSIEPLTELTDIKEKYIRNRIKLSIFVQRLIVHAGWEDKLLQVTSVGGDRVTVREFLNKCIECRDKLRNDFMNSGETPFRHLLQRASESWTAVNNPLNVGVGQQINEYLNMMRKFEGGDDEGGYLLHYFERGRLYRVFPGYLLLKLVAYLAFRKKENSRRFLFSDFLEHFRIYGIDFSSSAKARDFLMTEMQRIGLLKGSPDAGESVEIRNPFRSSSV